MVCDDDGYAYETEVALVVEAGAYEYLDEVTEAAVTAVGAIVEVLNVVEEDQADQDEP